MKRMSLLVCLLFLMGGIAQVSPVYPSDTDTSKVSQDKPSDQSLSAGSRLGPPQEAYTACKNKNAGDTASFVNPRGETVTGTCQQDGNQLVLRPSRGQGQSGDKHHGPPLEAYKACEGKSAGSTSQFVNPRGETVTGTCEEENGKMVLRPNFNKGNRP